LFFAALLLFEYKKYFRPEVSGLRSEPWENSSCVWEILKFNEVASKPRSFWLKLPVHRRFLIKKKIFWIWRNYGWS